jgi:recombination protein RecA
MLSAGEAKSLGSYVPYGISTGSICLDAAIGKPGIPGGRLTQVYGLDGTGKSTLMAHLMAECQKMGGQAVLFDTEDCYDFQRVARIGVDLEKLTVLEPDNLEELLDMIPEYCRFFYEEQQHEPGTPLLFVIDSADGLPPKASEDLDADDTKLPAITARTWNSNIINLLKRSCARYKCAIIIVSQQYTKIGEKTFPGAPPPLAVKGGVGIRYRASLRIEIKARTGKSGRAEDGDGNVVGYRNSFLSVKNKHAAPYQEATYTLTFDKGIDQVGDLYEACLDMGILNLGGGGVVSGKLGKKEVKFRGKNNWEEELKKLGGLEKVRKLVLRKAEKLGFITPYGQEPETTANEE